MTAPSGWLDPTDPFQEAIILSWFAQKLEIQLLHQGTVVNGCVRHDGDWHLHARPGEFAKRYSNLCFRLANP